MVHDNTETINLRLGSSTSRNRTYSMKKTAKLLGISRAMLHERMEKFGLL
ncbi:MAG: hypothetical protein HGA72_10880 [Chlorobiaceae bacterium]|nr:hypothetical protein [Chlorobiaceae bacterium]